MRAFKNILVGVDLSGGDKLVADRLVPHAETAFQTAVELARATSARLLLIYVLDISIQAQKSIERRSGFERTVKVWAEDRLAMLECEARQLGVAVSDWPITFPQFLANKIPHLWFNNTDS